MYILIAILLFGLLIFVHELGHYLFARIFHVSINEFSIGMGPKLLSVTSKKTGIVYSLRLLPIGGFVSMAGEDEESSDENAISRKPVWQRMIITAAGGLTNILCGIIVMAIIVTSSSALYTTTVSGFDDEKSISCDYGLMTGDKIVSVGPRNVHIAYQLSYAISRYASESPVDLTVIRNGEKIVLKDVVFPTKEVSGVMFGQRDFYISAEKKTFGSILKNTYYESASAIGIIYDSLYDLISGKYGINELSGPVGVTEALADAAKTSASSLWYFFVILAMNLGVVNLLPLPALDGGRLLFMLFELITKKKVNPKAEGIVHFIGIILLLILMFAITCKDIIYLFK